MALLWADGFDWMPGVTDDVATTDLSVKYDGVNLPASVKVGDGRGGTGKSLKMTATPARIVKFVDQGPEFVVGFAFRFNSGIGTGRILSWNDDPTGKQCQLELDGASDNLKLYRGATTLLGTSSVSIVSGTWYYIELYYKVDATNGAYELRVNGDTEFSGSGVNTRGVATDVIDLFVLADDCNRNVDFDDLYFASGSTFLGDSYVRDVFPTSDGDDSGWSPSSGADHYALIDDTAFDGDTSYLDGSLSDRDLFGVPSQSIAGQIHGVQLNAIAKKVTGTNLKLKQVVKSDGAIGGGDSDQDVSSTTYDHYRKIVIDDPATGQAWTPSDFNNAQWGIEGG